MKVLIITPIDTIGDLLVKFKNSYKVTYKPYISYKEISKIIQKYDGIFTNPNKSKVFFDKKLIDKAKKLKVICTASTGTNHLDKDYLKKNRIKLVSLTREIKVLKKISSTAELAFTLMLLAVRNIIEANDSVKKLYWDFEPFIGNQLNSLKIGVIGYGRLGSKFANYSKFFGSKVFVYDPFKNIPKKFDKVNSLKDIFKICDVISLHVHVNKITTNMINIKILRLIKKKKFILINTSRGELVNEKDILKFMKVNREFKYYTDVLNNEINDKHNKLVLQSIKSKKLFITPHIGGMTKEARYLAYNHAFKLFKKKLKKNV